MSVLDLANYLQSISYKLEAIERYEERLREHTDSPLCVSMFKDEWNIVDENCLICKDLMQRIEEREGEVPNWVNKLATFAWWLHGGPLGAWVRKRHSERADAEQGCD